MFLAARDPSWGVRTRARGRRRCWRRRSRSLMGSSNAFGNSNIRPKLRARDPSWGVRTRVGPHDIHLWLLLAIPHGEFEPGCAAARRGRRPALAIPHGEFEPELLERRRAEIGDSRSLMGSSNSMSDGAWLRAWQARDPSWGVRTAPLGIGRGSDAALAIPHGEFERVFSALQSQVKTISRSLMGSSNQTALNSYTWPGLSRSLMGSSNRPAFASASRRRSLAILMGSSNRAIAWSVARSRASRDPSWGVRTCWPARVRSPARGLAIPHGEFEPKRPSALMSLTPPRDPSWGVRTSVGMSAWISLKDSRSLMGSSNGRSRVAITSN